MASSSTSSVHKSFKYDVFLSFWGEDTRTNFVDHLYHTLKQKCIHTYKDDERIKKGKKISDELIGSIEDSKFYIIVFSKNYASSSWCLDELVKIMECHRTTEQTAYPVFYDVEPSEVRKQSGAVGEAFAKYAMEEAAGKWREALKEAADLAGWELKKTVDGHEAKFIQKIVEELSLELRSISFNIDEKLEDIKAELGRRNQEFIHRSCEGVIALNKEDRTLHRCGSSSTILENGDVETPIVKERWIRGYRWGVSAGMEEANVGPTNKESSSGSRDVSTRSRYDFILIANLRPGSQRVQFPISFPISAGSPTGCIGTRGNACLT
ncbi:hypothetical protein L2E82_18460 [Cichorium intybus]|uniref:Uncharacterized protein n=1 Tax=Cichorium intybus TaxID=13427 RepID=A0ACB9F9T5_CICIN|nr:hypothetical protein L2E82_18460 [Cichorium intybus]